MSVERRVGKKYRLGRRLGSGSFGEVWHGTDVTSGKANFLVPLFLVFDMIPLFFEFPLFVEVLL